jgi:hypothetical protein
MTVDTLDEGGWETWNRENSDEVMPAGPRSLGWAVSTEPSPVAIDYSYAVSPPPPYLSSPWEQVGGRIALRPRSSGGGGDG